MTLGERLVVALVRGLHGLNGAVRVEVLTDRPEDRFAPGSVLHREGSDAPLTIVSAVPDSPGWRLRFAEVPDRATADTLREVYLEAVVGAGEELGRGEFYWHEVIGSVVRDLAGRNLGTVVDVYRAGGVDAYVVRGEPYGEFDLPAVRDFIRIFAPRRGEIVVDADLLELTPAPPPRPPRPPRPRRAPRDVRSAEVSPATVSAAAAEEGATQPVEPAPAEPAIESAPAEPGPPSVDAPPPER